MSNILKTFFTLFFTTEKLSDFPTAAAYQISNNEAVREFEYTFKDIILALYNSLVRLLKEYCVQKHIAKLERVQRELLN